MKIKKAIFPVGGLGTRFLPATKSMPKEMLPVVDKPLVQYAVEEAANAGIEQFIFVTSRGKSAIENHFDHSFELENNLLSKGKRDTLKTAQEMLKIPGSFAYVRQQEPAGLGHAVWCARHLIGNEPVAILLADDLINGLNTTKEMINNYKSGNMLAIMDVNKKDVSSYGIITPGKFLENNIIEVQAFPESNDVVGLKDLYLNFDVSKSTINTIKDVIASGEDVSGVVFTRDYYTCLLYTSPSPRDAS